MTLGDFALSLEALIQVELFKTKQVILQHFSDDVLYAMGNLVAID